MSLDQWAAALQGFGAGVAGKGNEFMVTQAALSKERKQAMAEDFRGAYLHLRNGMPDRALELLADRRSLVERFGGDPKDTDGLIQLISSGDYETALKGLAQVDQMAVQTGLLDGMAPKYSNFVDTADGGRMGFNPNTGAYEKVAMPEGVSVAPSASGGGRTLGKSDLFKDSTGQLFFGSNTVDKMTGEQSVQLTPVGGDPSIKPQGAVSMVDPYGNNAAERIGQKGAEAYSTRTGQLTADLKLAPQVQAAITGAVEGVKADVKTGIKAKDNALVFAAYETAMNNVADALGDTTTGPIVGRFPAITANAQSAVAAGKILGVAIKGLVRGAGEGTWTDADQKMVDLMMPTREDAPEARAKKLTFLDDYVRAKFGLSQGSQGPQGQDNQQQRDRSQAKLMEDASGNKAYVYPDGTVEEVR